MAYKVLYRKYRPSNFNELYGQDSIKRILIESINSNKLAQAYIFSGPRGTGKTSTAKLFAKAINCDHPVNGIPCDKCLSCKSFEESPDIIEIDAASNNGVDEIRNLRENAKILPTFSKYKVYIIDEVHMLSLSAWNAFLKIIEEPPSHVIFILATTELQKIPITIISRCQRFSFKKIPQEVIVENLINIAKKENISIQKEAISLISSLSDGAMRDALTILDQLSKDTKEITIKTIQQSFGLVNNNDIILLFECMANNNINNFQTTYKKIVNDNIDMGNFFNELISFLLNKEIENIQGNNDFYLNNESIKKLSMDLLNNFRNRGSFELIEIILMSYFPDKIISREIIISQAKLESNDDKVLKEKAEKKEPWKIKKEKIVPKSPSKIEDIIKIRINNSFCNANLEIKTKYQKLWNTFIKNEIKIDNNDLISLIDDSTIEVASETNILFSNPSVSTAVLFCKNVKDIEEEFKKYSGININMICISKGRWQEEKSEYVRNLKNKKYTYIDENKLHDKGKIKKIITDAENLFEENLIEIK